MTALYCCLNSLFDFFFISGSAVGRMLTVESEWAGSGASELMCVQVMNAAAAGESFVIKGRPIRVNFGEDRQGRST